MKIILSPAKSLTIKSADSSKGSKPIFYKEALSLNSQIKKLSILELQDLMGISENLAKEGFLWNKSFKKNHLGTGPFQLQTAHTLFAGEVYRGLEFSSLSQEEIERANDQISILSGLYGIIKPMDLIAPYRLEMKTKFQCSNTATNLYDFWDKKLNKVIDKAPGPVINLASTEYAKVLKLKSLKSRVVTPVFKEKTNNGLKVVMMYAKNARGKMARYIIQNNLLEAEELFDYHIDNYSYSAQDSTKEEWVFIR
jgi:cytoplasmic iron level regulating protein YaaA (DUF328/UPF0246 family)